MLVGDAAPRPQVVQRHRSFAAGLTFGLMGVTLVMAMLLPYVGPTAGWLGFIGLVLVNTAAATGIVTRTLTSILARLSPIGPGDPEKTVADYEARIAALLRDHQRTPAPVG